MGIVLPDVVEVAKSIAFVMVGTEAKEVSKRIDGDLKAVPDIFSDVRQVILPGAVQITVKT